MIFMRTPVIQVISSQEWKDHLNSFESQLRKLGFAKRTGDETYRAYNHIATGIRFLFNYVYDCTKSEPMEFDDLQVIIFENNVYQGTFDIDKAITFFKDL